MTGTRVYRYLEKLGRGRYHQKSPGRRGDHGDTGQLGYSRTKLLFAGRTEAEDSGNKDVMILGKGRGQWSQLEGFLVMTSWLCSQLQRASNLHLRLQLSQ